jgi:GT2 family glycosyltransferase
LKLSIVIVNYNLHDELFDCIRSIEKSKSKIDTEIIIVDNSEKDIVSKKLKKEFKKIRYIKSKKNIGYGAGINLGFKSAKGEFILVLNPDTKLESGKLDDLIIFYKEQKNIGVVAPLLYNKNNKPYELQGTKKLTPLRALFSLSILSKLLPNNRVYKDYYFNNWNKKSVKEVDVVPTFYILKNLISAKD